MRYWYPTRSARRFGLTERGNVPLNDVEWHMIRSVNFGLTRSEGLFEFEMKRTLCVYGEGRPDADHLAVHSDHPPEGGLEHVGGVE